jgi:hypothetical protein
MASRPEFEPVGHCGGKVSIRVMRDQQGRRGCQLTWTHCRPTRAVMFAIYALPNGIPLCLAELGGIGSQVRAPAVPGGVFEVFIASDSEGLFGRGCPACNGYWRSSARGSQFCPYCRLIADALHFLTPGQVSYIDQFCAKVREALGSDADAEHIIDMDAVADAVGKDADKPQFYYAEDDILGRFGYCSVCGTWNGFQELAERSIPALRDRINSGGPCEACVRDAVSEFDSFVGAYVAELLRHVGMTSARRNRLSDRRFNNLESAAADLKEIVGIDILDGLCREDVEFAALMFHRRHLYEHKGGVADEKYVTDSRDTSVRLRQVLRETVESAHQIVNLVLRMAKNLHRGFHEILPPNEETIAFYKRLSDPTRFKKNAESS